MGMPADLAERQNIIDRFEEFLGHGPTEEEINFYMNTSSYRLDANLRGRREYAQSNDYQTQYAKIKAMEAVLTMGGQFDPNKVDAWIRNGYSIERILYMVRNDPNYRNIFPDKPADMTESDYMRKIQDMAIQAESTRDLWAKWNLANLDDRKLRHIYVGGLTPEAINAQREWERVKSLEASHQAMVGKRITTDVKQTMLGPVQQSLQGINSQAPNNTMSYEDFMQQFPDSNAGRVPAPGWTGNVVERIREEIANRTGGS